MLSQNTTYIPRLDHLRFFAAIWIFFYHVYLNTYPDPAYQSLSYLAHWQPDGFFWPLVLHGHGAVGFFIVLSGFTFSLITVGKKIDVGNFLRNRFLRIYPLYIFWIFLLFYAVKKNNTADLWVALFPFMDLKHNTMAQDFSTLWSTVIEVQIYLIFPFLKRFYEEKGPIFYGGLILLLIILRSLIYMTYGSTTNLAYWTLFGRLDQFLIGFLAGVFYQYLMDKEMAVGEHSGRENLECRDENASQFCWYALPIALVLCAVSFKIFNIYGGGDVFSEELNSKIWIIWPPIEAFVFAVFIMAYLVFPPWFPAFFEKTVAKLGELSFSIYVVQFLVLLALRSHYMVILTGNPSLDIFVNWLLIMLPCCLGLSWLTYQLIEKPFLNLRKKYV